MVNPFACYAKTPDGADAVRNRTHGLSPRVRQLLIVIDGKRDVASLLQLFPANTAPVVTDSNSEGVGVTALCRPQPLTKSAPAR